jgi:hypothetical protein
MAPAADDDAAPQSPGSAVSVSLSDGPAHCTEAPHSPPDRHGGAQHGDRTPAAQQAQHADAAALPPHATASDADLSQPRSSFDVVPLDDLPVDENVESAAPTEAPAEAPRRTSSSESLPEPVSEAAPQPTESLPVAVEEDQPQLLSQSCE